MNFFRWTGVILCLIVFLGSGYELLALVTGPNWPPTFSNLTQGLRDGGHSFAVFMISIAAGIVLVARQANGQPARRTPSGMRSLDR